MPSQRGNRVAAMVGLAAVVVLGGAGVALRGRIREEWYLRKLAPGQPIGDQRNALNRLQAMGSTKLPDALGRILIGDEREEVRKDAALALHIMNSEGPEVRRPVQALLRALKDPCAHVRGHSAMALIDSGGQPEVIDALIEALGDRGAISPGENGSEVREWVARVLGAIGPPARAAVPWLTAALDDPKARFAGEAALALAVISPDAASMTKAPALLLDRLRSSSGSLEELLPGIRSLGPAAREAAPILRDACRNPEVARYPAFLAEIEEVLGRLESSMDPRKKSFKIPGDQIRRLIPNMGACYASDRITVGGAKVGYLYREEPDNDLDSGWRFLAGDESQEYVDDPDNWALYDVNTICNYDPAIIPFLEAPFGSTFGRIEGTDDFRSEEFEATDD